MPRLGIVIQSICGLKQISDGWYLPGSLAPVPEHVEPHKRTLLGPPDAVVTQFGELHDFLYSSGFEMSQIESTGRSCR